MRLTLFKVATSSTTSSLKISFPPQVTIVAPSPGHASFHHSRSSQTLGLTYGELRSAIPLPSFSAVNPLALLTSPRGAVGLGNVKR